MPYVFLSLISQTCQCPAATFWQIRLVLFFYLLYLLKESIEMFALVKSFFLFFSSSLTDLVFGRCMVEFEVESCSLSHKIHCKAGSIFTWYLVRHIDLVFRVKELKMCVEIRNICLDQRTTRRGIFFTIRNLSLTLDGLFTYYYNHQINRWNFIQLILPSEQKSKFNWIA